METGLLQWKSNEELIADEEEAARRELESIQGRPEIISLAAHVRARWEAARQAKMPHEQRMLKALRMRNGEYESDRLALIRQSGGSVIYMMLPDEKCNAAEAWIEDILGDEPFGTKPTPVPDLSPQQRQAIENQVRMEVAQELQISGIMPTQEAVMQRGREILEEVKAHVAEQAKRTEIQVEQKIKDLVVESGWSDALKSSITDIVTHPAGFLKGPIFRKKKDLAWGPDGTPVVQDIIAMEWESPSPLDIYPAPTSTKIGDGYLFEKHRLTRSDLVAMMGVDGFDDTAIRQVLTEYGNGGLNNWIYMDNETERARLESRDYESHDPDGKIHALQFWGNVQGLMLLEYGIDPSMVEDPISEYSAEIWLIGRYVIKAELNGDPLGRPPYYKAHFRDKKGSFWGMGLPEVIEDIVDMCNASARNLANNMAMASGPMVGVDASAKIPGVDYENMRPWKIWPFDLTNSQGTRPPIWFFQPNVMVNELMAVYEKFSAEADNKSGVPKYMYGGENRGGAADTASGMSMMMSNASKAIKKIIHNIDVGIIEPSIRRLHQTIMLYYPDPIYFQGDIKFVAKGSTSMIAKEQMQIRRGEFLKLIMNPVLAQIVGQGGIAEVARSIADGLDMDVDDVVPTKEELVQRQAVQQQMMQQQAQQQAALPQSGGKPQPTNPAGDRAGGQDFRTF